MQPTTLFYPDSGGLRRLMTNDLIYVQGRHGYCELVTTFQTFRFSGSLQQVQEALPEGAFRRIHKHFLVAVDRITRVTDTYVMVENVVIPLGCGYEKPDSEWYGMAA